VRWQAARGLADEIGPAPLQNQQVAWQRKSALAHLQRFWGFEGSLFPPIVDVEPEFSINPA
jgi:hypothetical protein